MATDLKMLFEPRGVAVIGASRDPQKSGSILLRNLVTSGYTGKLYPINPNAGEIMGLQAYPTVEGVPGDVDLAVIAIPSRSVPNALDTCAKKGVKFVLVISAGFSEEGERQLQRQIVDRAASGGFRILGPNTTGVINTRNKLIATFMPFERVPEGNVSFVAQTGSFAGFILGRILTSENFSVSKVVGLGNKCDLDESEVLGYLGNDKATGVVALYLESVKNLASFSKAAKHVSLSKPVVALKSGRTPIGTVAMDLHTGSKPGNDGKFTGVCKRAGIIRVESFEALLDHVSLLAHQPPPKSNTVAVISNTGAVCVVGADSCVRHGLRLARLSDETLSALRKATPEWHRLSNPIDLYPTIEKNGLERAFEIATQLVINDKGVGAVIIVVGAVSPPLPLSMSILEENNKPQKPVLFVTMGNQQSLETLGRKAKDRGFPVYPDIERASTALAAMCWYQRWKTRQKNGSTSSPT